MNFYDKKENVQQYIEMAKGYDGKELIEELKHYLPKGSTLLEVGMGPGVDLDILKENYKVTGSDRSDIFLDRYHGKDPQADLIKLDALTLETDRKFSCLYSNKVLHHLSYHEMSVSFIRQAEILKPNGIVLHSFWYGDEVEEFEGLMFYQVTEDHLKTIVGDRFEILKMEKYEEMEEGDSLFVVLRLNS